MGIVRDRPRLRSTLLALMIPSLVAACVSTPVQSTPRSGAGDAAGLDLVGIVTVDGDTVRFDRPRADDPPSRRLEKPRVEDGEVRATLAGRPYRLPVDRVATWLHREPEPRGTLLVAGAVGAVVVGAALAFLLGGGFD